MLEHYLVPVAEAARLARIPKRTLYLWITEQRLTSTDTRPKRVDWDEVCELVALRGATARLPRLDHSA